jgi:hypothetical protein
LRSVDELLGLVLLGDSYTERLGRQPSFVLLVKLLLIHILIHVARPLHRLLQLLLLHLLLLVLGVGTLWLLATVMFRRFHEHALRVLHHLLLHLELHLLELLKLLELLELKELLVLVCRHKWILTLSVIR